MNFFRKFRDFAVSPSRSRTMGLVAILVLVSTISLTVIASQQQQTLKQRAAEVNCSQSLSAASICQTAYDTCATKKCTDDLSITTCNITDTCDSEEKQCRETCLNQYPDAVEDASLLTNCIINICNPGKEACLQNAAGVFTNCKNQVKSNCEKKECLAERTACLDNFAKCPTPTPTSKTTPTPTPNSPTLELLVSSQPTAGKDITITMKTVFSSGNLTTLNAPKRIQIWGGQWTNNWHDVDKSNCSRTGVIAYSCAVKVSEKEGGQKNYSGRISFDETDDIWTQNDITFTVGTAATTPAPVPLVPANLKITPKAVYLCGGQGSLTGGAQITITLDINAEAQSAQFAYEIFRTVDQFEEKKALASLTYPKNPSFVDTTIVGQYTYKYTVIVPAAPSLPPFESKPSFASVCGSGSSGSGGGEQSVTGVFQCRNYADSQGTAVNLKCVDVINNNQWCGNGWTVLKPASTDTKQSGCGAQSLTSEGQVCCKQNAAVAAVPTAIPTATPTPINNVILALALNTQDIPTLSPTPTTSITPTDSITPTVTIAPTFSDNLSVKVSIFSRTTNELAAGNPATQVSFAKTPIPKKQYAANMSLKDLPKDSYYVVLEKNGLLAITAFTVSTVNQTITVPTTTLVYGDINKDKRITALDWNALRNCWGKSTKNNPSCQAADFDQSGEVNPIDFNILMRGWATWNEEEKIVNL